MSRKHKRACLTPVPTGTIEGKIVFQTATGGLIYTVNGDGSNLKLLTTGIDPTWSPDGKQIAFARWGSTFPGLNLINADGSNEHLVYGLQRIRSPEWSPDEKYIAFTQEKTSGRETQWKLGVVEIAKVIDGDTTKSVLTEPHCLFAASARPLGSECGECRRQQRDGGHESRCRPLYFVRRDGSQYRADLVA